MDEDLRSYFATLSSQLASVEDNSRAAADNSREALSSSRRVEGRVAVVEGQIVVLNRHVFGSKPPPPPPVRPMTHSVSEHDGDIAEVKGELLAVRAELAEQSKQMGLTASKFWGVVHNTKVQDIAKLATLAAALYAALHGMK
jgi:hypothetical protein